MNFFGMEKSPMHLPLLRSDNYDKNSVIIVLNFSAVYATVSV